MQRLLVFTLLFFCLSALFGQEIVHDHSIYHAFIENKGQWHDQVLFKSRFDGGNLWVQQKKMVFHIQDFSAMETLHANFEKIEEPIFHRQTVVHLNFLGANEVTEVEKSVQTSNYYNYFIGNDPDKWASDVHGYGEALLKNLYDGVHLKLIEELEQLKYEFLVQPGINPEMILLEYVGQDDISINKRGDLVVKTALGEIIEQKPYAYQIVNGNIREVKCSFELNDNKVSFQLENYDPYVELVIDPVLVFATYSGSPTDNFGMTATYAYDGTAFSGGTIFGNAYPTPDNSAFDVTSNFTVANNGSTGNGYGVTDVFISHYSADGTNMIWTSFLGGGDNTQGTETVHSLICDTSNNVYLFGATSSVDFPIQGGAQTTHAGGSDSTNFLQNGVFYKSNGTDIYVAKLSANGHSLLGSTYMGGTKNDGVNYKTIPELDSVIWSSVTIYTIYSNPVYYDSLVSNYGDQFRGEIMLDNAGNCIVSTCTKSNDFPVLNAFQPTSGGKQDGVIFKLSSDLSTLLWSSYYGGSENDACYSVKVDSSQNIVFAGGTNSLDLPNINGWQTVHNGGKADGFVAKLNPAGTTVTHASYIGTSDYDQTYFCEIDRDDNVFLVGQSDGGNFPVNNAPFVNPSSGQFVIKLDPTLSTNLNSTVFGSGNGLSDISPSAFLVDLCGNIYISGWGANILQSIDVLGGMPVTSNAYISTPPNGFDFYLIVLEREMAGLLYGSYLGGNLSREHVDGGTSRFDKNGIVYQSVCGGCGGHSDFPTSPGAWSSQNLSTNCNNLIFKFDFELIPNAEFTVDDNMGCAPFPITFDNFSSQSDSYLWDFGNGDTSTVIFNPTQVYNTPGVYDVYLYVTDSICLLTDTAQITITVTDSLEINTTADFELCVPTQIDMTAYTNGTATEFIWSDSNNFTDTLNTDLSDSTLSVTPTGPITYYVQVSNPGCSLIDSVVVDFIGSSLTLSVQDSICAGESVVVTVTNDNPSVSFTYSWEPDSIIVTPSVTDQVTVVPNITQYVYVTASSNNGCVVEDSILIHVGNVPDNVVVASSSETLVPVGATVTLHGQPSGYQSYTWFPPFGLTSPTSINTDAQVNEETIYTLFVSDGICTKSDTVLVQTYTYLCDEQYIFVPNAFTPNGDTENDVLYVRGGAIIKEMIFRIYDRWGEMVFEGVNRADGWDGTFRGKAMDPDVYDYYLKVVCIDDTETIIKGNVTLLR